MIRLVAWSFALVLSGSCMVVEAQSHYCDKVRARANGEASLLIAPSVYAQGMRYPSSIDIGPVTDKMQLRLGLAFSPVELYRGLRLMNVSEADCRAHEISDRFERDLEQATEAPALPAFEAQVEFLVKQRSVLDKVLERARARLASNIITTLEFQTLRSNIDALDRKVEQLLGQASGLRARGVKAPDRTVSLQTYLEAKMTLEDKLSSLKSLDAWNLKLSGGVIPVGDRQTDYFAWVEFSYSLGGPLNVQQENKYLDARRAEMRQARYEIATRTRQTRLQLEAARSQAQRELAIIDRQLGFLVQTREALERADVAATAHVRDSLMIEQISTESERVYLKTLIEHLTAYYRVLHG